MSSRKKIAFKVVAGEYEDVQVLAVFEKQADAERYADKYARKHGHTFHHKDEMPRVELVAYFPAKDGT